MVPRSATSSALQAGALGELEMTSKNANALRTAAVDPMAFFGPAPSPSPLAASLRKAGSVEDLKAALVSGWSRVADCFRALDRDGDAKIDKNEFAASLPLLGFDASDRPALDAIFDGIDADRNGVLSFRELHAALRRNDVADDIDSSLRAGAMGDIQTTSVNATALRKPPARSCGPSARSYLPAP